MRQHGSHLYRGKSIMNSKRLLLPLASLFICSAFICWSCWTRIVGPLADSAYHSSINSVRGNEKVSRSIITIDTIYENAATQSMIDVTFILRLADRVPTLSPPEACDLEHPEVGNMASNSSSTQLVAEARRCLFYAYGREGNVMLCMLAAETCVSRASELGGTRHIIKLHDRFDRNLKTLQDFTLFKNTLGRLQRESKVDFIVPSEYDRAYTEYFLGVQPTVIPPIYAEITQKYDCQAANTASDTRNIVLVYGFRPSSSFGLSAFSWQKLLLPLLEAGKQQRDTLHFAHIDELYPEGATVDELLSHPAIIHIPFDPSDAALQLHYRLGVPVLVPTLEALVELHMVMGVISERSWTLLHNAEVSSKSIFPKAEEAAGMDLPDPNDDQTAASVMRWMKLSPYYTLPHLLHFDSFEHAFMLLTTTDLCSVSGAMMAAHVEMVRGMCAPLAALFR